MMKSFIFTLIIFSLLIALIATNSFFVRRTLNDVSALVSSLHTEFQDEELKKLRDIWEKKRDLLSYSIENDELERMNDLIECLFSIDASESPEEFKKYCRLIEDLSDELSGYEQISLGSIF